MPPALRPPLWLTLACIAGLALLALGHATWLALALADHADGRRFDVLDVFNALMVPGCVALAVGLARAHRRRRLSTRQAAALAGALTAVGLITTALVAVITLPFGGGQL
jgi:TPP-dependent trihydroxycyclohexane-1,2-dione (THcHDO) dehydratase